MGLTGWSSCVHANETRSVKRENKEEDERGYASDASEEPDVFRDTGRPRDQRAARQRGDLLLLFLPLVTGG